MKKRLREHLTLLFVALALLIAITFNAVAHTGEQVFFVYIIDVVVIVVCGIRLFKWLRKEVTEPMDDLRESIKAVANGNFDRILDRDSNDEIGEVSQEFENLRIKIRDNVETRNKLDRENRELIGNISHDLKTPITAIKGYAEGILDGVVTTPEQQKKYITTIYNKADDMARLIDELTYYTKIDTNKIPYKFEKVSPVEFFYDCVEDVGLDLETKGIIFTHEQHASPNDIVIADVEQLAKVVNNIVNNAVKYMDKIPGRIRISLLDEGDFVKFEIEDNGKGMEASELPRIFDRFYRTDASRNSGTGGSGIGLSISKKIIEDHGGKIWASSKVGKGSKFTFILRKYQEAELSDE
ncbi:MAG: HAMP domain-containing sensor histidine kinase [Lachnospiraceae bacterium]|nr:HAMP domain-containing sensor histidine kinase [Lachnospiraceae bacterium]